MNVAFFCNQFADAAGHGIARYARELHGALGRVDMPLQVHPVAAWSSLQSERLTAYKGETGLQLLPLGRRLTPLAWTFLNTPQLESMMATPTDLVHAVSLGYPVATRRPLVVTVHDLGPLTQPQYFSNTRPWVMRRSLDQALAHAARIICVSRSTADELLSYAGRELASRVDVVHEGVSAMFTPGKPDGELSGLDVPPAGVPYILCTGKISPRKNIAGVLRAFASITTDIPHHLVMAGGDGWEVREVHELAKEKTLHGRLHFTGFVSDAQLRALYAGASLFVHPSLYEGFGLTILEAMACGCPVVTSNRSSLPEVAGDAALLVDPDRPAAIASAMSQVCLDTSAATDLRARGERHAARFTWSRCATETAQVYASVC